MGPIFKLTQPEALRPASVLNLSSRILTAAEVKVLAKGQKFIPRPISIPKDKILDSFQKFDRRIKLTHFFRNSKKNRKLPFVEKSHWVPPLGSIPTDITEPLDQLKSTLQDFNPPEQATTLGIQQMKILRKLYKQPDIIIKPADKGSSIVVMDTQDYILEATNQLSNKKHYKEISEPVFPKIREQLLSILESLQRKKILQSKQVHYLKPPEEPRPRLFYLLPKIHKEKTKWLHHRIPPGRPIVSDCSSDTYFISELIDHYLQPISKLHPSYVKDTPDFISKIRKIKVPNNALLITLDVDALYTNIDNSNGLKAVQHMFQKYPDPFRPEQEILELLKLSLENNDFIFNQKWFLQIWGTAMGKKFAPEYADIFMANWEEGALSKCPLKPLSYLRFLDDIFIIWPHSEEDFQQFFDILNNHMATVKLKSTIHQTSIDFLDVTIFKGPTFRKNQTLDSKVFFKPTDTHQLLHKESYHPKHTFAGIIKSQILRFYRICSNLEDFQNATTSLYSALIPRGYSKQFLRKITMDTLRTLKPPTTIEERPPCSNKCTLCGTYINPTFSLSIPNRLPISVPKDLNCNSKNIVYAITCSFCKLLYVGQTSRTIRQRTIEHRSNILTQQDKPLANHINLCPLRNQSNTNLFYITPLEHITPVECPFTNRTNLINKENYWIKKLDTIEPKGINLLQDLPPPIPFVLPFSESTKPITAWVQNCYQKIQNQYPNTFKAPLVMAHSRNKNVKDFTVATKDPKNPT